jgi:hypothetical protein
VARDFVHRNPGFWHRHPFGNRLIALLGTLPLSVG